MKIFRNRKLALFMAVILMIFMGLTNTLFAVFAAGHDVPVLYVTYEDGEETETDVRDHPSKALHFDVYKSPSSIVVSATLHLPDGTKVQWSGNGSEHNNLDDEQQGGYWHWIYTPSGVLTISNSNYDGEVEEILGDLYIEKEILGFDGVLLENDFTEFTVNVQGPKDYNENHTFAVNDPLELIDLPEGEYTIEEVSVPYGYALKSISSDTITLNEENPEAFVTITNEKIFGSITIEKVLLDIGGEAITKSDTDFMVNIKGDDYDEDHEFSVDESKMIEGLSLGDYTLSEINIPDGFEFVSIVEEEITLSEEVQDITVIVTNQVKEDIVIGEPGALIIEKLLLDVDDEAITDDDTVFMVNIEGDEYDEDHEFSVNEPLVLDDLEPGDYYINELEIPEGFEFVEISPEMVTISENNQEDITVIVTNQVEEDIVIGEPGALIIEKLLLDVDDEAITDDDTVFMVNIEGDEYDEDHEFSVNEPLVLDDLEPGDYYINELEIPEGFEFVEISHEMVTISENNQEDITVIVTNQVEEILEEIDDDEIPEGTPEEEIILDEEMPLGDGELPRTGQRHARDFYLLGFMISGLGVFLKRFLF